MLHVLSTTLIDFYKTLQPITDLKNMQVFIAPIVKDKLLYTFDLNMFLLKFMIKKI